MNPKASELPSTPQRPMHKPLAAGYRLGPVSVRWALYSNMPDSDVIVKLDFANALMRLSTGSYVT